MSRNIRDVVAEIDSLSAVDDGSLDDVSRLENFYKEYFASPDAAKHVDVWFRVYERFPNDHGYGIFWSILHGLEAQPGCERAVVDSVRRRPTHYPVMMVSRLLNGGVTSVDGVDLVDLLRRVARDGQSSADVREQTARYLGPT